MSGSWETLAPLPNVDPLSDGACCGVGDKLYLLGGRISGSGTSQFIRIYDSITDAWVFGTPPPVAVGGQVAAARGTDIYTVVPGADRRLYRYSTTADTWTQLASAPNEAGSAQAVWASDGKMYVPCPRVSTDDVGFPKKVQVYNPATDTWALSAISGPRNANPAVGYHQDSNRIYTPTGATFSSDTIPDTYYYDIASDTWVNPANPAPRKRANCGFGMIDDRLYLTGGRYTNINDPVLELDELNLDTGVWTTHADAPQPTPSVDPFSGVVNAKLHIAGGRVFSDTPLTRHERYTPNPSTFRWVTGAAAL